MSSTPRIHPALNVLLRERRGELHLSQREAAEAIGVSERTLQAWEYGAALPQPRHRRAVEAFLADEREAA